MATVDEYGNPIDPLESLQNRATQSANGYNGVPDAQGTVKSPTSFTPPQTQAKTVTQEWTRQNVLDTLSKYGAATQENLNRAVAENPWLGATDGRGRLIDTTGAGTGQAGRTWDVIGNLADKTGATTHWQTLTGNTARAAEQAAAVRAARAPLGATGAGGASAGRTAAGATGSTTLTSQQSQDKALRDSLIAQLQARAQQSLAIDPLKDPILRAQADAYAAQEERARRNYLADQAEALGPLANLQGEERMAAERVGQRTGAFTADLAGREVMARRQEIADALQSMQGMLTVSQEMSLRKELALMDDAINRMKLAQGDRQFNADLGYRNRALSEQGRQFDNTLGYNYDTFDWDRSPLNPRNIPV